MITYQITKDGQPYATGPDGQGMTLKEARRKLADMKQNAKRTGATITEVYKERVIFQRPSDPPATFEIVQVPTSGQTCPDSQNTCDHHAHDDATADK